jgi:hypothetical protein
VTAVTQGANGAVSINQDGTVRYTPNANYNGSDSFTYTLNGGATATVNVTVTAVDDAPTNGLTGAAIAKISVDETTLGGFQKASYAANFNPDFGGDGAGATGQKTYALSASEGATTLKTAAGDVVSLQVSGGTVRGTAAGATVFTISINSLTGEVAFEQNVALQHGDPNNPNDALTLAAGIVSVLSSVTDTDGDEATAALSISEHLTFLDDGPSLTKTAAPVSTLIGKDADAGEGLLVIGSFANSFAANFGADGGAVSYKLIVSTPVTGLISINGKGIALSSNANGTVITGAEVGGGVAFKLMVDPLNGDVTLEQNIAMKHASNAPLDLNGAVKVAATATDRDGDRSSTQQVDVNLSFVDSTAPVFLNYENVINVQFKSGVKRFDAFEVDYGNDVPPLAGVTFKSAAPFSQQGLILRQVDGDTIEYAKSLDPYVKAFFVVDIGQGVVGADVRYNIGVPFAPKGLVQRIEFDKIPAGSPTETVTAKLSGSYGGSITIDGMLVDKAGAFTNPGSRSTNDDINTNSTGFGIKGGQASQINPGEGFKVAYNSPGSGELNHLTNLSFDVHGVGNIENVIVRYQLFRNGINGAPDTLIDVGTRSTSVVLDEHGQPIKTGLKLTDGQAHNISLFDDGGADGGADPGVGDYFDYALVSFVFPTNNKGVVDQNQGVRVGTFFTEIIELPDPDSITFELQTIDGDGDIGLSGLTTIHFDPAHLGQSSLGNVFGESVRLGMYLDPGHIIV